MVWGTAANFVVLCMRQRRSKRCWTVWNVSSITTSPQGQGRPQRMLQQVSSNPSTSKPRAERRIAVRLPLKVRGRDSNGINFEEETSSENLCRGGAAFRTRFDVAIGSDLG